MYSQSSTQRHGAGTGTVGTPANASVAQGPAHATISRMTSELPDPNTELREDLELSHFRAAEIVTFDDGVYEMPPMMSANPPAEANPSNDD
jgi:hypothetical protein